MGKYENRCKSRVKIALEGVTLTTSGCSLGTNKPIDDYPPGPATAFGNGDFERDDGHPGIGGHLPGGGGGVVGETAIRPAAEIRWPAAFRWPTTAPAIRSSGAARTSTPSVVTTWIRPGDNGDSKGCSINND